MAVKIRLKRLGKIRAPYYRVVIADSRTKRDGRSIETIGKYHPKEDPSFIEINSERAAYWLGVGAQPTEAVEALLKVTGDWQKFKGLPAPPPMLVKAEKVSKQVMFEAAAKGAVSDESVAAEKPAKKPKAAKAEAAPAEAPAAEAAPAEAPAAEDAEPTEAAEPAPSAETPAAPAVEASAETADDTAAKAAE